MKLLNQLKKSGYDLTLTCNEYRQGKDIVVLLPDEVIYFDVFFENNEFLVKEDFQVVIEVLCVENVPKTFRVQLRVPNKFRVVDTWKELNSSKDPQPILDTIKVLKREMKRELIEIDCI
tara:strand:+ start:174 stop:530 length:357 start_codon:yes stop_codon:yes gene_type:complete